jgi:hypothetical protein
MDYQAVVDAQIQELMEYCESLLAGAINQVHPKLKPLLEPEVARFKKRFGEKAYWIRWNFVRVGEGRSALSLPDELKAQMDASDEVELSKIIAFQRKVAHSFAAEITALRCLP